MSNKLKDFNHPDLLFPGNYVKAADLRGKDVVVVIDDIEPRHELQGRNGKKERKPVVKLHGKEKLWVLNKTNTTTIAKIYGNEITGWIGKSITIYPTRINAGGEEVDAIRVRPDAPKKSEINHDPVTGEVRE